MSSVRNTVGPVAGLTLGSIMAAFAYSKTSTPFYTVAGNRPELILDFRAETYVEYPYSINDNDPELVLDFRTETYEAA